MSQAIHPIHQKQTRRQRRGFVIESEKIEPFLADLETKFELSLFKAPSNLTYSELYEYFNGKWAELVDRLLKTFELKYIAIDIHHFPRMYKARHLQKI